MPSTVPDRRHIVMAVVLVVHLAALWLMQRNLQMSGVRHWPDAARLPSLVVRLIAPSEAPDVGPTNDSPTRSASPQRSRDARSLPDPAHQAAPTGPSAEAGMPVDAPARVIEERPADAPPLRLGLPGPAPHESGRNPALDDPRTTAPSRSISERFAQTLGTDTTAREERLADGSLKIRRGNDCVLLKPSRNAEIDPMDDRSKRMPATASRC